MESTKIKYKLPQGWVWTTIGEIGHLSSGGTPSRGNTSYYNGDIPWVKSGELNYNIIRDTEEKISLSAVENSSAKIVPENTLLIALYGSTVGKLATLGIEATTNQAVAAIKTFSSFNQRFLYYYLFHNRERLLQKRKGGAQPNINQKILIDFPLPLPPFIEQNNIITKIDQAFSELDQAKSELEKTKQQLKIYKQALLKHAFSGKLTESWRIDNKGLDAISELTNIQSSRKNRYNQILNAGSVKKPKADFNFTFKLNKDIPSWADASLDNLIGINARIGWKGLTKKEYTKEGPLFLSVHALNYGKNVVFGDANHITIERYDESPEIKLQLDNILLCKDGAGIGKVGIIKNLPDKATVNSSLLVIDSKEVFNPDFLYYFFLGPTMQKLVNEKISGSAIPHLFQKDIKQFNLKVPPKQEQNQIVEILESRFTIVEHLEKSIDTCLSDSTVLRHSILKKAFDGKLVSQDSNDEPATELLEKIKTEKEVYIKAQKELDKLKPKKKRQMETKKTVLEILKETNTPISTQELWTNSVHNGDIESFYEEIKEIHNRLIEVKENTESLLSLKR
jgi:type I restriction enzyme S subunit